MQIAMKYSTCGGWGLRGIFPSRSCYIEIHCISVQKFLGSIIQQSQYYHITLIVHSHTLIDTKKARHISTLPHSFLTLFFKSSLKLQSPLLLPRLVDSVFGEDPTPGTCPPFDFPCSDGSCIPVTKQCDGFSDCPDNADELNCTDNYTTVAPTSGSFDGKISSVSRRMITICFLTFFLVLLFFGVLFLLKDCPDC